MSAPKLISKISIAVHLMAYIAAINDNFSNKNELDSLHTGHFKEVGTRHFLFDEPQISVNIAFHYMTLLLFIPLIILVNVLVLLTVGLIKRLHTPHDVMIAISSLMDLLVGVIYLPADIFEEHDDHTYIGQTALSCELVYISILPFSLSLTSYVLMSTERWVGVVFPFWYQMNVTCLNIAMASAIVLCAEIAVEITFMTLLMQYDKTAPIVIRCEAHKAFPEWYIDVLQTVVISLKLAVSLILCIYVNIVARKHRQTIKKQSTPVLQYKKIVPIRERHSLKPIICSLIFIILWLPKLIFDDLHLSNTAKASLRLVDFVLESFLVMNSFVNPLLIISMKPLYRDSFKTILSTPPWKLGGLKKRLRRIANQSHRDYNPSSTKSIDPSKRASIGSENAVGMSQPVLTGKENGNLMSSVVKATQSLTSLILPAESSASVIEYNNTFPRTSSDIPNEHDN